MSDISIARWRCPSTLNCGSDTSFDTPTELGPSFHLYRMSRIVYPTVAQRIGSRDVQGATRAAVVSRARWEGGGARRGRARWGGRRYYLLQRSLPVVRATTVARCRWPSTRNCGNCTSLLMPTLDAPSFQTYSMSVIVYPTPGTCQTQNAITHATKDRAVAQRNEPVEARDDPAVMIEKYIEQ